jgi:ferrous iron transport protein B
MPPGALRELIAQGVVAGVGNVVVFLPQIVILFGFIAVLEYCGYMARAAFLMDRIMSRSGLSGKSFIPMLTSFACAIPGVMATRTIEDRRDRLATILVAPLMSCSARLPVYVLLIGSFIPAESLLGFISLQGLVLLSMYLIGLVLAPLVAWLLKATLLKGQPPVFLLELPSYKKPSMVAVLERMVDRGWAFLKRAGTLILASTIVLWALQYYPRPESLAEQFAPEQALLDRSAAEPNADAEQIAERQKQLDHQLAAAYQADSYLGRMGKAIEPVVVPLGWDWRIGMAAIASFPAREVVVSALGTIFSVGAEEDEESSSLRDALKSAVWPDGRKLFTIPTALSLMVFFALCCQCAATLSIIARETNSWRWPAFTFIYMTGLAYVGSLLVYQIGSRL